MTGSGLGLTTGSGQRPIESHVLEIFCVSLRVSQSQITIRERNLDADLPAPRCQLLMKRKNLGKIVITTQQEFILGFQIVDEQEKLVPEHSVEYSYVRAQFHWERSRVDARIRL
jgi:hypothetical protein